MRRKKSVSASSVASLMEKIMIKTTDHAVTEKNRIEHLRADGELTEAELNHVSGGTPPKQEAVFPTETIKLTYGAIEWTYTPQR